MTKIKLGEKTYSNKSNNVFIIAEAGVNHDGNINKAYKLIDIASRSGADAVKFQAFNTKSLIKENVKKAKYQSINNKNDESQFEMLKSLELRPSSFKQLKAYSEKKGLIFLTTPFDIESLNTLIDLNLVAYKVASTDTTNLPFLIRLSKRVDVPILLSTGMCFMDEVKLALKTIKKYNDKIVLMQCTSDYPANIEELNLNVLNEYKKFKNCILGFSDHSVGNEASLMAIAMGARVIEKHFTVNRSEPGPDHSASLEPHELEKFIQAIRDSERMLGEYLKKPTKSELDNRMKLQKSIVTNQKIKKGEKFSLEKITAMRVGGKGISPISFKKIINRNANKDYEKGEIILKKQVWN